MDTLPRGERRRPDIVTDLRGTLIDYYCCCHIAAAILTVSHDDCDCDFYCYCY